MLNEQQQEAVKVQGHCLVTACPGSGKTSVLSHRAEELLQNNPTGNLLAVTFTRDAAKSLKERILEQSGSEYATRVAVGTLHSLALNQIRRGKLLLKIASPSEQSLFKRRASESTREPISFEDTCKAIDHYKSSLEPAPAAHVSPGADAYHLYQSYLDQAGMQDFSDLLILAAMGMKDGSVKPFRARWLLVDEAQDLDEVQMAWVEEHAKAGSETMLVADDDQSIYGWRHAMGYAGLSRFRKEMDAKHVTLPMNYRCDQLIINAAAKLISCNLERVPKSVTGASQDKGILLTREYEDRLKEAEAVAEEASEGSPEGFAVLARTNTQLNLVEQNLTPRGIPYWRASGKSVWELESPGTMLGLLQSVITKKNHGIATALHYAQISPMTIEKLHAENGHTSFHKLLSTMKNPPNKVVKTNNPDRERLANLANNISEWEYLLSNNKLSLVVRGVSSWVKSHLMPNHIEHEVCDNLADILLRLNGPLLSRIKLLQQPAKKKDKKGVALMTLHSSKGLEWDRVWIIGVEDEKLPHIDSPIEEERRLCYVGMTRARNKLNMSWTLKAKLSPFITDAGLYVQDLEPKEE